MPIARNHEPDSVHDDEATSVKTQIYITEQKKHGSAPIADPPMLYGRLTFSFFLCVRAESPPKEDVLSFDSPLTLLRVTQDKRGKILFFIFLHNLFLPDIFSEPSSNPP